MESENPLLVVQVHAELQIEVGGTVQNWPILRTEQLKEVRPVSGTLATWHPGEDHPTGERDCLLVRGIFRRVRIIEVNKGPKKKSLLFYYGRLDWLNWDPKRLQWPGKQAATPFMDYNVKLVRDLLREKHIIPNPVERKWQGILPFSHQFKWNTVWAKPRIPKEAGLLWLVWHRAVAVNVWKGRIDNGIDTGCPICPRRSEESVLHRFWECP